MYQHISRPANPFLCHTQVTNNNPVCTPLRYTYRIYCPLPLLKLRPVFWYIECSLSLYCKFPLNVLFAEHNMAGTLYVYILNMITIFMYNIQTSLNFTLAIEEPNVDIKHVFHKITYKFLYKA